jgi:hypothetical protein
MAPRILLSSKEFIDLTTPKGVKHDGIVFEH